MEKRKSLEKTQEAQISCVCSAARKRRNVTCIKDILVKRERDKCAGKAMWTEMSPALFSCLYGETAVAFVFVGTELPRNKLPKLYVVEIPKLMLQWIFILRQLSYNTLFCFFFTRLSH
jgi:hypothetical protein